MSPDHARYLTPPKLASRWGCNPESVIALIRSGELIAFDLAHPGCTRTRYRISPDAIAAFELRRSVVTPIKAVRRQRRDQAIKDFV